MTRRFLGAIKLPATDKKISEMSRAEIEALVDSMGDPIGDAMRAAGLLKDDAPQQ